MTVTDVITYRAAPPAHPGDFPDPCILHHGGTYYAYGTNTVDHLTGRALIHLPVLRSADLRTWEHLGEGLGALPAWAEPGFTWAPDVTAIPGGFALYTTLRERRSGQQAISVATSLHPEGPFEDHSPAPLIRMPGQGGVIDAHALTLPDGARFLYWKNDGNAAGLPTRLWVQRLSADGLALIGEPREILSPTEPWEGNLIEAPSVLWRDGHYHLLYSAGHYGDDTYCIGHARSLSPTGPFEKTPQPLLRSSEDVKGPGGQGTLVDRDGRTWLYYHAWTVKRVGYGLGGARELHLSLLTWPGGAPHVQPLTPQEFTP